MSTIKLAQALEHARQIKAATDSLNVRIASAVNAGFMVNIDTSMAVSSIGIAGPTPIVEVTAAIDPTRLELPSAEPVQFENVIQK